MNAVGKHDKDYIKVIGLPATVGPPFMTIFHPHFQEIVSPTCLKQIAHLKDNLEDVVRKLYTSQMQCILVTPDEDNMRLRGVVSYADLIEFIIKFSDTNKCLLNNPPIS